MNQRRCSFEGCNRSHNSHGLCAKHDDQRRAGVPLRPIKAPRQGLRGNQFVDENGYVAVYWPEHPNAVGRGYVKEHTIVMSDAIGRPLRPGESVHHINGIRDDNRVENLELWSTSQPYGQRVSDKVEWATQLLQQYAPERLSQ